jgi:hypothetical protein
MSLWVPVVAALGASLLTTLGALALEAQRQRAAARAASVQRRRAAYAALIQAAHGTLTLSQVLRSVLKVQSGLDDSISVLMRLRKPVNPFDLAWRLADELTPLLNAQAGVLSCGSPRAAFATKDVVSSTSEYLQAATVMTNKQRALIGVIAWKPTEEQDKVFGERLATAGVAIQSFITVMREELGEDALPVDPVETRSA